MTKIIWMSDPHYQNTGTIDGLDPRQRLKAALAHANTHHSDAACIVMSGDLVGDDIAGDYAGIADCFAASDLPVYPLMGNNDDRAGMRRHLTLPPDTADDFVQYVIALPDAAILCLDSHKVGSHAGSFCAERRAWLKSAMAGLGDQPVFVFMHHPPFALGLPMQDQIMLEDGSAFLDLLKRYDQIKYLFMGHVHRPTCGVVQGIPYATLGALSFQAPAPQPSWDWDRFVAADEPPHYGVVLINDGNVTVQHTQFCTADFAVA